MLFYASLLVVFLVAGIILWAVASVTGVVDNVETFIKDLFALDSFHSWASSSSSARCWAAPSSWCSAPDSTC